MNNKTDTVSDIVHIATAVNICPEIVGHEGFRVCNFGQYGVEAGSNSLWYIAGDTMIRSLYKLPIDNPCQEGGKISLREWGFDFCATYVKGPGSFGINTLKYAVNNALTMEFCGEIVGDNDHKLMILYDEEYLRASRDLCKTLYTAQIDYQIEEVSVELNRAVDLEVEVMIDQIVFTSDNLAVLDIKCNKDEYTEWLPPDAPLGFKRQGVACCWTVLNNGETKCETPLSKVWQYGIAAWFYSPYQDVKNWFKTNWQVCVIVALSLSFVLQPLIIPVLFFIINLLFTIVWIKMKLLYYLVRTLWFLIRRCDRKTAGVQMNKWWSDLKKNFSRVTTQTSNVGRATLSAYKGALTKVSQVRRGYKRAKVLEP